MFGGINGVVEELFAKPCEKLWLMFLIEEQAPMFSDLLLEMYDHRWTMFCPIDRKITVV